MILFLALVYIGTLTDFCKSIFCRSFRQRIQQLQKEEVFANEGGHTFFIPIDEGFKVKCRLRSFGRDEFTECFIAELEARTNRQ